MAARDSVAQTSAQTVAQFSAQINTRVEDDVAALHFTGADIGEFEAQEAGRCAGKSEHRRNICGQEFQRRACQIESIRCLHTSSTSAVRIGTLATGLGSFGQARPADFAGAPCLLDTEFRAQCDTVLIFRSG
jgi:hypothetical protein